jgi:predicted phage terminase large subunit-like protein
MSLSDAELRKLARTTPAGYAYWCTGKMWVPAPHLQLLSQKIVDCAVGRIKRLMVFMPPRHGKSMLISEHAPAWYLGRWPDNQVLLATYSDEFSASWGRKARDVAQEFNDDLFGVKVDPETSGGKNWEILGRRGVMVSAGVGGGITGRGAHLAIIDDPVKNQDEAFSETMRDKHHDWWKSTLRTRLMPDAAVILVMTRWHEDDLAGRLIKDMVDGEGDQWEILSLPAIASSHPDHEGEGEGAWTSTAYPPAKMLDLGPDPLGRQVGEALWPSAFDEQALLATKRAQGSYWFGSMYQQTPQDAEGNFFKRDSFRHFHRAAPGDPMVTIPRPGDSNEVFDLRTGLKFMTVDAAETEKKTSDYTVASTWVLHPVTKEMLLVARRRGKFDPTGAKNMVRDEIIEQRPSLVVIEKKSSGTAILSELVLEGYPVVPYIPDTDKVARALVATARYEAGRVLHPSGPGTAWVSEEWEPELLAFPGGTHDDQVDTVSLAAAKLVELAGLRVEQDGSLQAVIGGGLSVGTVPSSPLRFEQRRSSRVDSPLARQLHEGRTRRSIRDMPL